MKILLISDFFVEELPFGGGAEYNDKILSQILDAEEVNIARKKSASVSVDFLTNLDKDTKLIISNFVLLKQDCKQYIQNKFSYIIYEHDHKYLIRRDPSLFRNLKAPKSEIVNYLFYKNAAAVFSQSGLHKKIIDLNLHTDNVVNLSGNLWSKEDFEQIRKNLLVEKQDIYSILQPQIPNKGPIQAIEYCNKNNHTYELISDKNYYSFLRKIANNKRLVFLPTLPETFSRICVEARMMGCSVTTNGFIGAKHEEWYSLEPEQLILEMESARERIANRVIETFK